MNALRTSSLVLAGLIVGEVTTAVASPMRDAARQLACSATVAEVEAGLAMLEAAPTAPFGLPEESLAGRDDELDSVAIDGLLDALALARQRFPELGGRIVALVERWDFCAITSRGERWDLSLDEGGKVLRRRSARMSPLLGSGYAAWSLLPRTANGRPRPAGDDQQANRQDAAAGSSVESLQCRDGDALQTMQSGPLPVFVADDDGEDASCQGPPPPPPPEPPAAPPDTLRSGGKRGGHGAAKRRASEPGATDEPREVASPDTREAAAPPPGTISAQLVASARGNLNLGTGLSLAPLRNTFVRAGLSWRLLTDWDQGPAAEDAEPSWSWGIGYDDWRPGTFSLQLNHWGPLRRFRKVALEGAVATLGYKIPLPKRWSKYFSLRTDLSTPLTWSPSLGAGIAFKLPRHFFLSLGVSQKLLEDLSPTWSYVLGRSRWKAGTLAVVLANYGPNRLDQLNLRGLALSLSWSWSL